MRIRHQEKEQTSRHIDQGDPLLYGRPAPFRARRSHGYGGSENHAAVLSWGTGDGKALCGALLAPPAIAEQAEATVWLDRTTPPTSPQSTTTIVPRNRMIPSSVRQCPAC